MLFRWEDGFDDCLDNNKLKKEGLVELTGTYNQ